MNIKQVFIDEVGLVSISRNRLATRYKIAIRPDGSVRVTIPWLASYKSGENFLAEHLQWISETKDKVARKPVVSKYIQSGHLFTTRNYQYHVGPADISQPRIRYNKNERQVFFEFPANQMIESIEIQNSLRKMIENVLRFDAKKYLPGRITELALNLGYTFKKVTIKNNKTNWGSCSNRKNINLNLHLMRLNDRLIDYVIVHELVHTIIPNHGPDFKATMKRHYPDTDEMDKELKKIRTGISTVSDV